MLDSKFFGGADKELPPDLAAKLTAKDLGAGSGSVLTRIGWEGQLITAVGLLLSADGALVQNAQFMMRGALHTAAIAVKANTIWDKVAKGININVVMPDSGEFSFSGGELVSDYLHQDATKLIEWASQAG